MFSRIISITSILIVTLGLAGCLIEAEVAIKPDPKVDHRLEGVWQITEKHANEIRGARDEDNIGVYGYIVIAAIEGQEDTYKAIALDGFEADSPSKMPEMLISTRKHKGHNLLLVRLAEHEAKKVKGGAMTFKNWVVDYEFNESGELFLRFWLIDDFDKLQETHPMKFDQVDEAFSPVTLKGDEASLLDYYTDPKVRALLMSMGKYRKLMPQNNSNSDGKDSRPSTTPE